MTMANATTVEEDGERSEKTQLREVSGLNGWRRFLIIKMERGEREGERESKHRVSEEVVEKVRSE